MLLLDLTYLKQRIKDYVWYYLPMEPNVAVVEVTNICNMRCKMCPTNSPEAIRHRKGVHMDYSLFEKIINDLAGFRKCHVVPQGGGEPLLHPRFMDMLKCIKSRPNLTVGFVTNGSLLTDERTETMLDLGVEEIGISIDAHDRQLFQEITQTDKYDQVCDATRRLIRRRKERGLQNPFVRVQMVMMPDNQHQKQQYIDDWIQVVDEVCILKERDLTGRMVKGVCTDRLKKTPCIRIWREIPIGSDGQVVLCCEDWHEQTKTGHATTESLRDIWFGSAFQDARQLHKNAQYDKIPICRNCYALYECLPKVTMRNGYRIEETMPCLRITKKNT